MRQRRAARRDRQRYQEASECLLQSNCLKSAQTSRRSAPATGAQQWATLMIYALRRSLLGRMHSVWRREREPGLVHTTGGMVLRGGSPSPSSPRPRGPALASGTPSCRQHGPCASRSTSKALNSCKKQIRQNGVCPLGRCGSPISTRAPPKLPEATPMNAPRRRRSGRAAGSATEAAWGSPPYAPRAMPPRSAF